MNARLALLLALVGGPSAVLLGLTGCPSTGELDCRVAGCPFGQVCEQGTCRACAASRECGAGLACVDGRCEPECDAERGCADGRVCRDRRCEACVSDVECAEGQACREGRCAPACLLACDADQVCWRGRCTGCQSDPECGPGRVCDDGRCVPAPCSIDADCGAGRVCEAGACLSRCSPDGACPRGLVCRDRSCETCRGDGDCPVGSHCTRRGLCAEVCPMSCTPEQVCSDGRCRECQADDECEFDAACDGGACRARCAADEDCPIDSHCTGRGLCAEVCPMSCSTGEVCSGGRCRGCLDAGECGLEQFCELATCASRSCAARECGWGEEWCGSCPPGQACGPGARCEAPPSPLCWSSPLPLPEPWSLGPIRTQAGVRGMFASTGLYRAADWGRGEGLRGCSRHAFIPLADPTSLDFSRAERLPSGEFDFLLPFDCALEWTALDRACDGDAGLPSVRQDLLEMFFISTYPCYDWSSEEIWSSHRATVASPWSTPEVALGEPRLRDGGFQNPVLLPDQRTLLFVFRDTNDRLLGGTQAATRGSTRAGDLGFGPWFTVEPFDEADLPPTYHAELVPWSLSCDGNHLIYSKNILRWLPTHDVIGSQIRIARIEASTPPRLVDPRPYPAQGLEGATILFEAEDCDTLWVAKGGLTEVRRRIPCPP